MATEKEVVFSKLADMSLDSDNLGGGIFTVEVGPERRCFQVHLQCLGNIALEDFSEGPDHVIIQMPDDDPQAFNLFMNWQYNRAKLPRVPDLSRYAPKPTVQPLPETAVFAKPSDGGPVPAQAQTVAADSFAKNPQLAIQLFNSFHSPYQTTETKPEDPMNPLVESYNHICFSIPLRCFSQEELRLLFQDSSLFSAVSITTKATITAPTTSKNVSATGPPAAPTVAPTPVPHPASTSTTIPSKLPATVQAASVAAPQQGLSSCGVTHADKRQRISSAGTKRKKAHVPPGAFPSSNGSSGTTTVFAGLSLLSSKADYNSAKTSSAADHGDQSSGSGEATTAPPQSDLSSLLAAADADAKTKEDEDTEEEEEEEEEERGKEDSAATDSDTKSDTPKDTDSASNSNSNSNSDSDSDSTEKDQTIPSWIPTDVARKAQELQDTLLSLCLLAEKYSLPRRLFNEAMDAFRHGEEQLSRTLPGKRHITRCCDHEYEMFKRGGGGGEDLTATATATTNTNTNTNTINNPSPSLAARFMYDYAYALAATHRRMAHYVDLFAEDPGFAAAMLRRVDGEVEVPGFQMMRGGGGRVVLGMGPLDAAVGGAYRYPVDGET